MLKNIREIGIFMIAAQAVIHFAPGKQYGKYIKSVSGIIILILFLRPFLQLSGVQWKGPEDVLKEMEEAADMPDFFGEAGFGQTGVDSALISRMEAETKALLNRELEGDDYCVKQVSIRFEKDPSNGDELYLSRIEIEMGKAVEEEEEEEGRQIGIDRIVIGSAAKPEEEPAFLQYRSRFAALLEIEEERVEVR